MAGWFAGKPPQHLGASAGRLAACPAAPNCVSSQDQGAAYIAPLAFSDDPRTAWERLRALLESLPRTRLIAASDTYLRAEASSRVFGFVDDVEFLLDPAARVVHVRSASRLGRSDFGVNRRRVEAIRASFADSR